MTSVSKEAETRYQAQLQEQLQAMRADNNAQIAQNRAEIDEMYKNKLAEAQNAVNRHRTAATEAREESGRYRLRVQELETTNAGFDAKFEQLNRRIVELEGIILCNKSK